MNYRNMISAVVLGFLAVQAVVAQPTNNLLTRVLMVESGFGRGTIFSLDVDQREYWITAKHMFTGVKTGPAGVFTTKRSKQTFSRRSAMAMRATICIG